MGVAPRANNIYLIKWATTWTCFKDGIWFEYARQPSSNRWTLTTVWRAIWTSNWKFKFSHVCIPIYFNWGSTSIQHSILFFLNNNITSCPNLRTSTLQPMKHQKFSWNDDVFYSYISVMKLASTCKYPLKTNVDDIELKYPQRQGLYENLKFIEMHPKTTMG